MSPTVCAALNMTPRSSTSTPAAIRAALAHYSTWTYSDGHDIAEAAALQVATGDVGVVGVEFEGRQRTAGW